jgi:iron complex transport system substrate-binding protein
MKKLLIVVLVLSVCMTGCGRFDFLGRNSGYGTLSPVVENEPQPFPVTIDDVVIYESPAEIVSLSPALSEILFEFGEGERLIGRSEYCDYPRALRTSQEVEIIRGGIGLDVEAIALLSPDLLLLSSPISEKDKVVLEREGVVTVVIPAPKNLEEFKNVYRLVGVIVYGGFIGADEGEVVFSDITRACNNPDVIDLGDFVYITENMSIATGDTLESSVLSCFGNNLAKDAAGYVFDPSELLENQPNTVLLSNIYSIDDLTEHAIFSQLNAVKELRVITLNNLYFERPSLRIVTLISELKAQTQY